MRLTVEYNANAGHVVRDGEAEKWVDEILETALSKDNDWVITVSSALLIDFFRLKLAQGIIKMDQIEFTFNGVTLEHNKYGRITPWPKGYCDIPIEPMEQILTIQSDFVKKRAKKRKKIIPVDNELTGEQDISWKKN